MALIEEFHVVATHYPVQGGETIREGQFVQLDTTGNARLATGVNGILSLGVSGDSTTTSASTTNKATPFSDQITINAAGSQIFTQNRVSDNSGNETLASGRITVYNGGGQFHTDQFETLDGAAPINYTPGDELYVSTNGKITTNVTANQQVATVVVAPRAYPSGVPGTDTPDGSLSLGSFITFKLDI